eukprot:TRINITY_DN4793_c0_g1_i1.p1 TRINITY_DN4793_c0_g1~~TRINITY_DN4793_c0_g1_i1.p1  ORF type:complete len:134 (+),score=19.05 TRINITY_DN4793_c0_g1_i1:119-520(+)
MPSLVGSEMCIRDRYQRRVHGRSNIPFPAMRYAIVPVTPFDQNCTIFWCENTRQAAVIDPGGDIERILRLLEDEKLTLAKRRRKKETKWLGQVRSCLLYTSDAADDMQCVDLGSRRVLKKKQQASASIDVIVS